MGSKADPSAQDASKIRERHTQRLARGAERLNAFGKNAFEKRSVGGVVVGAHAGKLVDRAATRAYACTARGKKSRERPGAFLASDTT